MNVLIVIIAIISIVCLFVNHRIKSRRVVLKNDLRRFYGELETQFVKECVILDNITLKYLDSYKVISVYPDLLDIQVLSLIHHKRKDKDRIHRIKSDFDKVRDKMSQQSNSIVENLDYAAGQMIKLSALRVDFLFWFSKVLFKHIAKSIGKQSLAPLKSVRAGVEEMIHEKIEILFFGRGKIAI
jgi:uncharacterized membrane-anchored protein YhcB (DUF1043 family)